MEYLNNIFLSIFLNTTILVVWFITNAYYEYLSKIFPRFFNDYIDYINNKNYIYYSDFLETKSGFFNKLLSCPFCIGFWTAFASSLIYNSIFYICVIYIGSLLLFFMVKKYAGIN